LLIFFRWIKKLVKFRLKTHIYPKISQFFCWEMTKFVKEKKVLTTTIHCCWGFFFAPSFERCNVQQKATKVSTYYIQKC
jgi:hypothetical protein